MESDTSFKAISYVWGDPNDVQPIICNGGVLMVTRNLFAFLRCVRESGETSLLWADAICINQRDDKEKTFQVRMMGEIYRKAKSVIAWLGEEGEHDAAAFELMRHLCPSSKAPTKEEMLKDVFSWTLFTEDLTLYPGIVNTSAGLSSLWSRPWFSRVWIVQEMVVTDNLTFRSGKSVIESEIFFRGSLRLTRSSYITALALGRISVPDRIHFKNLLSIYLLRLEIKLDEAERNSTHLLDIVNRTRTLQATDPRDKVYALIGLATDTSHDYIDYAKDLREVLIHLAKDGYSNNRTLFLSIHPSELLSFAVTKCRDGPHVLPSWVPPFHNYPHYYTPLADCLFRMRLEDMLSLPKFSFGPRDTMSFSGAVCDTIITTKAFKIHSQLAQTYGAMVEDGNIELNASQPLFKDKLMENLAIVVSLSEERLTVVRNIESYPTGEDPFDAYWRTLMCNSLKPSPRMGRPDDVIPPAEFRYRWQAFEIYIRLQPQIVYNTSPLPPAATRFEELRAAARPFETKLEYTSGRKFCVTKNGYMGMVPEVAEPGDQLVVVKGTRILFVVSPYKDGYRLLGDAYIHGLMDGKACDLPNLKFEEITLL
jgi:hypothetical protein